MKRHILVALSAAALLATVQVAAQPSRIAIVGGTVIDGNGGPPIRDAVVLLDGPKIAAIGPRASVTIPSGTQTVDAQGRWIVPGLFDTNVHLSLYGGQNDRYESLVRYQPREEEIVVEAAQIDLS